MEKLALLVSGKFIKISLCSFSSNRRLYIDGFEFSSESEGGFAGFHDWLRCRGTVIGARFWPHVEDYVQGLPETPYTVISVAPACISIFWGASRVYKEIESADQSFAFNILLKSGSNAFCLILDVQALSRHEVEKILDQTERIDFSWI